jgi:regulator of cell morphogenesis and NO signaling
MIKPNDTLGSIVTRIPSSTKLFEQHKIDYCCNGYRSLEEALKNEPINIKDLLEDLNTLYDNSKNQLNTDWTKADLNLLVEHILNTHHAFLYEMLPVLSELTTKILRVHGIHHPKLSILHKEFHMLKTELEAHLIKEETIQYPAIYNYLDTKSPADLEQAKKVIDDLESEHAAAGDLLKSLRNVTNDYSVPEDTCGTYEKTYEYLEMLEKDMFQHIHLENNILFKRLLDL